jgi:hypothetical protein
MTTSPSRSADVAMGNSRFALFKPIYYIDSSLIRSPIEELALTFASFMDQE